MIKYLTVNHETSITECEIERETDTGVWVKGERSNKHTRWKQYHNSYDEAFSYLDTKYRKALEELFEKVASAKGKLHAVQELKKP
jgi:hypothetical protein